MGKNFLYRGRESNPGFLGFQGKNLQDSAAAAVNPADGLANSGRREDEVWGGQAGADNLRRANAMKVLTLHLSKLRTSLIQTISVISPLKR